MDSLIIPVGLFLVMLSAVLMVFLVVNRHRLVSSLPKDPVDKVYDAIDFAIKNYQPYLEIEVTHMSSDVFVAMYRGIRSQGVKVDIKQVDKEFDFLTVDLREYKGPRNQNLDRRMDFPNHAPRENRQPENVFHAPITKKVSGDFQPNPYGRMIRSVKPVNKEPATVIDLAEFRRRKQKN